MAITQQQVKIYKSQVIADTPDGGGRMTGLEVVDGELNNLFDDTSRVDRVNGRVSLRKCFGAVVTNTRDKFLGAHAIVTRPPLDGRVHSTILDIDGHADQRADAKFFVEKYLIPGAESQLTLYSNQPVETRTLLAYQADTDPPPATGDVYFLSVESAANVNNGYQQAVRVLSVMRVSVSSTDAGGPFFKALYTLELSEALEITYPGQDLLRAPQPSSRVTRVRRAELNPVAKYYGISAVTAPVAEGDALVKVSSILSPIVPAAFSETPLLDKQVGASIQTNVAAGPRYSQSFIATAAGGSLSVQLLRASVPGSVSVVADDGGTDNDASFAETGNGVLTRNGGGVGTTTAAGSVVAASGQITLTGLPNTSYTVTVSYLPAVAVSDVQHTKSITITLANRGFNYAETLVPKPAPGAVVVAYRTLGNWYELRDNGKGNLVGAPGTGAGTVNYLTGTVNATLGYQPDVGSRVLFGWGTGVHYTQSVGAIDADIGTVNGQVSVDAGLVPGSVTITYVAASVTYTVTDDGAGLLTGDGSGSINYAAGTFELRPSQIPAAGTGFSFSAQKRAFASEMPTATVSGGNASFSLADPPALARTVRVRAVYSTPSAGNYVVEFADDGGSFRQITGSGAEGAGVVGAGTLRGSINLSSGAASLPATIGGGFRNHSYTPMVGTWNGRVQDLTFVSIESLRYTRDTGSPTTTTTSFSQAELRVDFSRGLAAGVVPGSLLFTLAGRVYFDSSGSLYYRAGAADVLAGSLDYLTGRGVITAWASGPRAVSVQALLSKYGQWLMSNVVWRTESAPIRSQSFQITKGTAVATASSADVISSDFVDGLVDLDLGVYELVFSPPIVPELARYNAVALTYLPLDADIIGLNAVRLPLDGRVPIFADGQTLVLLNDALTSLPNPVIAGQTYALGRSRLAYAILLDANGLKVPTSLYTSNLDTGHITFANPLDLSGYVQPLVVEHRIEDMFLCLDAQLSGDVSISGSITHDYPALGTYLASAKLYGDLQSAASAPFSQAAWTGVWSDSQIGASTSGQYNAVANPIEVSNAGAIQERWRLEFTSVIAYRLIGETVGQVAIGNINDDFAPINPSTGAPYFTVRAAGWGSGWVAGNQVRLNTISASAPIWLLRCTLQGPADEPNDAFRIQFRGDN